MVDKAVRGHKNVLGSVFETDPEVLRFAKHFARHWCTKYLGKEPFGPYEFVPTPGACYERSRS